MSIHSDEIKRVKGMGFLNNRGTDAFSARVITENTCLSAEQMEVIAEASRLFGSGTVSLTTRMTVEIMGIPYENIDKLIAFLAGHDMQIGGTGDKVRPITSCKGSVCVYGKIDTHAIAKEVHDRFYMGYRAVQLPHKFKIGVGGCSNNCVKPMLNDVGLVGSLKPVYDVEKCRGCKKCRCAAACPVGALEVVDGKIRVDEDKCILCGKCESACIFDAAQKAEAGIRVFIGGTWGKSIRMGTPLRGLYTKEGALNLIEKVLLLYKENGRTKERLGKMVDRLGIAWVENQLAGNGLLQRKEEILQK